MVDLKKEASKIIESIYGPVSAQKIEAYASEFPPDKKPREFLDKCKGLIATMFGEEMATKKLADLYSKI